MCVVCVCPLFPQVLKKYPHLWCMTKPPSRRPKLYIVNLQVTQRSELLAETWALGGPATFCPELMHLGGLAEQGPGCRALGRSEVLSSFTFPCPQWTPKDDWAALKLHGRCDDVMQLLMDELGLEIPRYSR